MFSFLLLFILLFLLLRFEEQIYVILGSLIIFHILPCLPVLSIGLFLLLKNLIVFQIQIFYLWYLSFNL